MFDYDYYILMLNHPVNINHIKSITIKGHSSLFVKYDKIFQLTDELILLKIQKSQYFLLNKFHSVFITSKQKGGNKEYHFGDLINFNDIDIHTINNTFKFDYKNAIIKAKRIIKLENIHNYIE